MSVDHRAMYTQLVSWSKTNPDFTPKDLYESLGEHGATITKYLSRLNKHHPDKLRKVSHGKYHLEEGIRGLTFDAFEAAISEKLHRADLLSTSEKKLPTDLMIQAAQTLKKNSTLLDPAYQDLLDDVIETAELIADELAEE